jgi:hypothetical protein
MELLHYFRWYLYFMTCELVIYGTYLTYCLYKNRIRHRLFLYALLCFVILFVEIKRIEWMFAGAIPPTTKYLFITGLELLPFGLVAYEIVKKVCKKVHQKLLALDHD